MGLATGPIMSESAQGALGKTIIFTKWKGKTRIKIYKEPKNPQTTNQQVNRTFMQDAVAAWQTLTAGEKAIWEGWV